MEFTFTCKTMEQIKLFADLAGIDLNEVETGVFEREFKFGKFKSDLLVGEIFKDVERWTITMEMCPEATKDFFEMMTVVTKVLDGVSEYQEFSKKWLNEELKSVEEPQWICPIIYDDPKTTNDEPVTE